MDLYLKFPDVGTANLILFTDWVLNYRNIDVIGILTEGGQWDDEGNEIAPPTTLDGWHVNIRLVDGEDVGRLAIYKVEPKHPRRVWG